MKRFRKQEACRYKRVGEGYRRPRGFHSKMREHRKGNLPLAEVGYRAPSSTRGMHPSGLMEILVHNLDELLKVPKGFAVRIASGVGIRKKIKIAEKAKDLGLKILNVPRKTEKKGKEKEKDTEKKEEKPAEKTAAEKAEKEKEKKKVGKPKKAAPPSVPVPGEAAGKKEGQEKG